MPNRKIYLRIAMLALLVQAMTITVFAAQVTTLEDIDFWVGTGDNRAGFVLDWDYTSSIDEALVWGYRWDGVATGQDMLLAILTEDNRLYAKLNAPGNLGIALYGWGYDQNNNGQFGLSDYSFFNADGITLSGPPDLPPEDPENPPPTAQPTDPADDYNEGWYTGFWSYNNAIGDPFDGGSWSISDIGVFNRGLSDGDWDAWSFSSPINLSAQPANPHAAEAPLTADFNANNIVDGTDFLAWQRGSGITSGALPGQGDATGEGAVDNLDLTAWSNQYGSSQPTNQHFLATGLIIPEPTSSTLALCLCVFIPFFSRFTLKRICS